MNYGKPIHFILYAAWDILSMCTRLEDFVSFIVVLTANAVGFAAMYWSLLPH